MKAVTKEEFYNTLRVEKEDVILDNRSYKDVTIFKYRYGGVEFGRCVTTSKISNRFDQYYLNK